MSAERPKEFGQRLVRPLLWSILAGLAIYGGAMIVSDVEAVGSSMARLGLAGWTIILGLSLGNYGLRFVRWEIYLGILDSRIPLYRSMAYYIGGFAFTTTPGKAGEAVRSLYLKRHGVAYVDSLAAFFTERFMDLVAMALLALSAAMAFPSYRWPVVVVAVSVVAAFPLVHSTSLHAFADRQCGKLPWARLQSFGLRLLELLRSSSKLLRWGPMYGGLVLGLVAWGAEGVAFYVILESLGVEASIGLAVGIYAVSVLAGALSFIPGGLGSTEAVMVLMLTLIEADVATAVAATLICRLATLWFAVLLGGVVLVASEVGFKANARDLS
jgi:uncharacterized membrane protein YbhN (UPF0104 family)